MQKEDQIIGMLKQIISKQDEHNVKQDEHIEQIPNTKDFTQDYEDSIISVQIKLLRDEIWANRVDIHRMKNTLGLK
ncbi:hypothetical protein QGM71_07900 [Virgibacillus sp. C22-A2]|uniref:DUF2524 family protein n=1 Tax=Virgibacillus tibetensis TaxID=3042313 RepID=A0ABU6KDL5_9BACI|nr:hypothetical protein [Virgibacillus sp. C22-A2]